MKEKTSSVEDNLEAENPNPVVLDRFPETDYEDIPFTENVGLSYLSTINYTLF